MGVIHTKKFLTILLAAVMTLSLGTVALADGATTYSDKIVTFLESFEGYSQNQYEDPVGSGNYFIGYGSACAKDAYPNGVTQAEAEQMLRAYLDGTAVTELNAFLAANGVSLNQNQYDALISLTYNMGGTWMSDAYRIGRYVKAGLSNYSALQIVDAMGVLSHQGTTVLDGLITRRIREAQILLYGDYQGTACPQFSWLVMDRNGGTLENDVFCYQTGTAYGTLPEPTLAGKYFAGWQAKETGNILRASDTVSRNLHATATWSDTVVIPFTDVKNGTWYYNAVGYCYAQGLMSGTSATLFSPDTKMTRAMLVTVLWTMSGKPTVFDEMAFTDVPDGQWYTEPIRWAASQGIVSGTSATTFGPEADISREQLVAILYKFAQLQGKNVDYDPAQDLSGYSDTASVTSYAVAPLTWAVQMGIVSGFADGTGKTVRPQGTASRAQVAQIVMVYTQT
ncbi:MAG: S-layer homology domain-containing protein [Oscillospiraceae bacterium]|nr:S-layer homology domain-containing protein [Oscillospiraceae bacterium]